MLFKKVFLNKLNIKNFLWTSCRSNVTQAIVDTSSPLRMKSWQVHSFGEELRCFDIRQPIIRQPNEVLVKVEAASVNPIDVAMLNGYGNTFLGILRSESILPITLGRDFCGKVLAKGNGVSNFNIGDRVYGVIPFNKDGSHSEIAIAEKSHMCRVPENITLSHVQLASIPYAALTAWSALWIFGGLNFSNVRGKHILILGGSGGVGSFAIQMLKAKKATVSATCSQNAIPLLETFKTDAIYDYNHPDFNQNVAATGRYDIILDCANFGQENLHHSWLYSSYITLNSPLLKDTDKYGLVGGLASCVSKLVPANLNSIPKGRLVKWAYVIPCEEGIKFINDLVKKNEVSPMIDSVFSFNDTKKAYEKVRGGHLRGKVVIDLLPDCDNLNDR